MPAVRQSRAWTQKPPLAWQQIAPQYRSGLVAVWAFNEGGGPVCSSGPNGQNYNMTASGGPTWVRGRYGPAMQFTGSSNQYLSCNSVTELLGASNATIFALGNATQSNTWCVGKLQVGYQRFGFANESGQTYWECENANDSYPYCTAPPSGPFSMAMAYDGTLSGAGNNRTGAYINGIPQTLTTGSTVAPATLSSTGSPFYIGWTPSDGQYQTGITELVVLWAGRTLTAGEILSLHNNPPSLWAPDPGAWLYRGLLATWSPPSPYLVFPSMYFPSMIEE